MSSGLQAFPNAHLIWTPQQLHARLGDSKLVILDVRPSHEIMQGVIQGAAHFDLYGIGLTHTAPAIWEEYVTMMRSLLGLRGVNLDKTVVVYEGTNAMRSGRAFWLLEYIGHKDVHLLDGGLKAWTAAGYPVVREMAEPHPASFKINLQPHLFIGAAELQAKLAKGEVVALDVRADDEHFGEKQRAARAGTIPGSVHLDYLRTVDAQGKFKPPAELEAMFQSAGLTKEKAIVPF